MRIRFYGTRGSSPVCRNGTRRHGGNTTCLRVLSACLPTDTALLIDAGSGLVEATRDLRAEGIRKVLLLMTHYHHDHTMGFPIATTTLDPSVEIDVFGPREDGIGPREVFDALMRPPHFPVPFARIEGHVRVHGIHQMESRRLLVHRKAGFAWEDDDRIGEGSGPRPDQDPRLPPPDSLRIRMTRTIHPEYTISYRLEEGPTGRVAALLTDHEASDEVPDRLRTHLQGVHLLIQDAQYSHSQWKGAKAGYGHGTGAFAAKVMHVVGAARLGLTHHDPEADDPQVDAIREEARRTLVALEERDPGDRLFSAQDYQEEEV